MRRRFSQIFLENKEIARKIVNEFIIISKSDNVVEIGPGKGVLTDFLLGHHLNLTLVEIDSLLSKMLIEKYGDKVKIINMDFLELDLSRIEAEYFIGNLPYHISTRIVKKLLEYPDFKGGVFMLQKEVVKRISTKENSSDYGYLSALVNLVCKTEYLFEVSRKNFYPVPEVDSAVISIQRIIDISKDDFRNYMRFIGYAFGYKRKTLLNSLNLSLKKTKQEIMNVLKKHNLCEKTRAEELSPQLLYLLSKEFNC